MADLQNFGGYWTQEKLKRVSSYLTAYTNALKNTPFKLVYIDAFAGTGYRTMDNNNNEGLFADHFADDAKAFHDGSAKIALQAAPRFDKYYFIEQDPAKCSELEKLKQEFPDKAKDINIIIGDANQALQTICEKWNRKGQRAVLFLDPFGMNVSSKTIEAIAKTESIDMWYLFPLSMGVMRLLKNDGNISESWQKKLDDIFGEKDWREKFYKIRTVEGLLWDYEEIKKTADANAISEYFVERLETIFAGVVKKPLTLYNAKKSPLYLLCFACGNKKGRNIALKIAGHISKGR